MKIRLDELKFLRQYAKSISSKNKSLAKILPELSGLKEKIHALAESLEESHNFLGAVGIGGENVASQAQGVREILDEKRNLFVELSENLDKVRTETDNAVKGMEELESDLKETVSVQAECDKLQTNLGDKTIRMKSLQFGAKDQVSTEIQLKVPAAVDEPKLIEI